VKNPRHFFKIMRFPPAALDKFPAQEEAHQEKKGRLKMVKRRKKSFVQVSKVKKE